MRTLTSGCNSTSRQVKINHVGRTADIESYGAVARHDLLRPRANGLLEKVDSLTFFDNKKVRYLWTPDAAAFVRVSSFDKNIECTFFHSQRGLCREEEQRRRVLYGNNEIEVRVQTVLQIVSS